MIVSKYLDPKSDVAFQRIFGKEKNKDILIHFINDIQELSDENAVVDVEFLNPTQPPTLAIGKESILDVLCRDINGVQFIVEMQVAPEIGFEKRAQYYATKAYNNQMVKGPKGMGLYHNLKEVVFIAILNYTMFPNKPHYKSKHVILDEKSGERDLRDLSFTFIELPKFKKTTVESLSNLEEKWCYFFKYAEETTPESFEEIIANATIIKKAYKELISLNWTKEELGSYEREQKHLWDEIAKKAYVKEEGKAEGKAEGLIEGIEKGMEKEKYAIAKKLLQQNSLDIQMIAQITGLSIAALKKIV